MVCHGTFVFPHSVCQQYLTCSFSDSSSVKKPSQSTKEGTVSSDEFVKIMMTLQNSSQLVADPSKTLSAKAQTDTSTATAKRSREDSSTFYCQITLCIH